MGFDGDAEGVETAIHEEEDGVQHVFEVDRYRGSGFAVEAEHGAADLGDALGFLAGEGEEVGGLLRGGRAVHEEEEIGDGVERVVDLMRDGGGEAAGDGKFFIGDEGLLGLACHGDVAEDEDEADDLRAFVADGGEGVVDLKLRAVLAEEEGVFAELNGVIQTLAADDGIFNGLMGLVVKDGEDLAERLAACLGV